MQSPRRDTLVKQKQVFQQKYCHQQWRKALSKDDTLYTTVQLDITEHNPSNGHTPQPGAKLWQGNSSILSNTTAPSHEMTINVQSFVWFHIKMAGNIDVRAHLTIIALVVYITAGGLSVIELTSIHSKQYFIIYCFKLSLIYWLRLTLCPEDSVLSVSYTHLTLPTKA